MTTFAKMLTFAATSALGFGLLAATPAAAFDSPYDDQRPFYNSGSSDYEVNDYDRPAPYGYDRPAYGYDRPAFGVRSGAIAICPPGYHLGRGGALCWPN